jgi:hypothetical protein
MSKFYEDDNMWFSLQEIDGALFAHVHVELWNKSILYKCMLIWQDFKRQALEEGHNYLYSVIPKDKKILKFNVLFGAVVKQEFDDVYLLQFKLENEHGS